MSTRVEFYCVKSHPLYPFKVNEWYYINGSMEYYTSNKIFSIKTNEAIPHLTGFFTPTNKKIDNIFAKLNFTDNFFHLINFYKLYPDYLIDLSTYRTNIFNKILDE